MFPKLQKKFVILYTLSTGLIMTFILSIAFLFYASSQENRQKSTFQEHLFTLMTQLQVNPRFADSFLAQMEQNNRLIIYIEENGTPFFFPGAYETHTDREILLKTAEKAAQKESIYKDSHPISSDLLQSSVFQIAGDKRDSYLGNILILRTASGYKKLILLRQPYKAPGNRMRLSADQSVRNPASLPVRTPVCTPLIETIGGNLPKTTGLCRRRFSRASFAACGNPDDSRRNHCPARRMRQTPLCNQKRMPARQRPDPKPSVTGFGRAERMVRKKKKV